MASSKGRRQLDEEKKPAELAAEIRQLLQGLGGGTEIGRAHV